MPPDFASKRALRITTAPAMPDGWRKALVPLGLAWALIAALFASDLLRIAELAWNISTFNHIVLVPLILVWLAAQRWPQLARIEPVPWWPGLLLGVGGSLLWVLGEFSGLNTARQLGVVVLLISTIPTFLGARVSCGLTFPLFYALLLVPIGEELVPVLQLVTARITVLLVSASGVPAAIDGVFIDTPAGLFEVAEACSGVKFLVAMLALGMLVANVCFRSWRRRAIFMVACIVVPILANGIRAFATIYVAQFVGADTAAGFDHIVYGWFFFAIVVALVLAGSWRFFDRPANDPMIDAGRLVASPILEKIEQLRIGALAALAVLVLLVGGAQGWARAGNAVTAGLPERITLPDVRGWHFVDYAPRLPWRPKAEGAGHRLLGRYSDDTGRQVDVFFALYASQGEGREAGGFGQGALTPGSGWSWHSPGPPVGVAKSEVLRGDNGDRRLALTWYRTGALLTGSNARLKLANMGDRLLLRARPTALLIISSVDRDSEPASDAIQGFLRDAGPVDQWMDHIGAVR